MGRTKATEEPAGYVEIGTYLFRNQGSMSVKTLSSVNSPLKLDTAEDIKQVKKIRVETRVTEDKSVTDNCVYQKNVETIQLPSGNSDPSNNSFTSAENPFGEVPVGDDFKRWTKNIIDKLIDAKNTQWVVIGLSLVIGALGLGLALGR